MPLLNQRGLKKLHNAIQGGAEAMARETIAVIAFSIDNDEDLRKLLAEVAPAERHSAYESLRSHLSFKPKPLAYYEAETAEYAETHQLPTLDPVTGALKEFVPASVGESLLEVANQALSGKAVFTCRKCTVEQAFYAETQVSAAIKALQSGWTYHPEIEAHRCPECSVPRDDA